jgi:hypothetical protein
MPRANSQPPAHSHHTELDETHMRRAAPEGPGEKVNRSTTERDAYAAHLSGTTPPGVTPGVCPHLRPQGANLSRAGDRTIFLCPVCLSPAGTNWAASLAPRLRCDQIRPGLPSGELFERSREFTCNCAAHARTAHPHWPGVHVVQRISASCVLLERGAGGAPRPLLAGKLGRWTLSRLYSRTRDSSVAKYLAQPGAC